ncbi:MAG TPA: hypothetical protein VHL31_13505 [Geminicoccus sp.]|jgi:multidrug resistance efflux pump|uniref:hypothetical protein n=1 Tax=Geminicoccus sp. TaxID=2024832 RepID=UPI002E36F4A7|nr:hypothetical protein [Geminicoccus sp.]HEX2527298.1 hypothetical protein [Geminicoccus sp.]
MSTQTRNRMIILAVVVIAVLIGLVWPYALDNTKRIRDAEKAAEQGTEMPADR